ncbi:pleckstrin homology domain-containing family A member 3-like isoform X2 [Lycorma delicatula]|uniref:pleckstrin homology domain-containing family A member 3-like isoform X2 n=1 Tax=Lycorma delicatula TaxID=130591 RepID=UPI003F5130F2
MEGVLWKWTNYWSGWQTRWFILEDGVLSYYMSQEEVGQGCKGSMKVSALEIVVSNVDNTRMDLVIPGEKHMYLRAATSQERQQWLVALGSSKACLTTATAPLTITHSSGDKLRSRKVELKLYADLLMQQVHTIKEASKTQDVQKIEEGSSLLEVTCDTFIKTLEDCMEMCSDHSQTLTPEIIPVNNHYPVKPKATMPSTKRLNSFEKKT